MREQLVTDTLYLQGGTGTAVETLKQDFSFDF